MRAMSCRADGFTENDIILQWANGCHSVQETDPCADAQEPAKCDTHLDMWEKGDIDLDRTTAGTSTGRYSRLLVTFNFHRRLFFYFATIYLPSIMVVMISWVSFWIARESAPARVLLGITTVLSMTQILTTTNRSMPPVSYLKGLDIFLGMCYFLVVASLLEYAIVSYSSKKTKDRKLRKAAQTDVDVLPDPSVSVRVFDGADRAHIAYSALPSPPPPLCQTPPHRTHPTLTPRRTFDDRPSTSSAQLPPCTCPQYCDEMIGSVQYNNRFKTTSTDVDMPTEHMTVMQISEPDLANMYRTHYLFEHSDNNNPWPTNASYSAKRKRKPRWTMRNIVHGFSRFFIVNPVAVDRYSRVGFPLVFLLLNLVYWIWLFGNRGSIEEALEYCPFNATSID